jgi:uncharacterized protein YbjT (DUF2867 family)
MGEPPSRVLLLGATGLIGSAVAARLQAAGHEVIGMARRIDEAARRVPAASWIELDISRATRPEDWAPHLAGIEAVVNCAGVLQDSARDSTSRVHRDAPAALWRACEEANVRRIVQMSAMGAETGGSTAFLRTKQEGDLALTESSLDWVILRPSVVLGRSVYGGSALLRALAAWPLVPRFPEAGPLDVVQLDDVAETVTRLLKPGSASRVALDLGGPDRLTAAQVIAYYRRWFGWPPAREIRLPAWLLALGWKAGDLLSSLGWRPPMRTTARRELVNGAAGDNRAWREATGIQPRSLADALAAEPASVQERWFARLYLLKPLVIGMFAFFWLATGLITLGPGREEAMRLVGMTAAAPWSAPLVIGGALFDVAMGVALVFRRTAKPALVIAFLGTVGYLLAGTLLMPELWADPLGRLLKILPIIVLNLVCLAILDER